MARTDRGRRLTEQHRLTQSSIVAAFLARFLGVWPMLDPTRLDETTPVWLGAVLPMIADARQQSADEAVDYYRRFAELDNPGLAPVEIEPVFSGSRPGSRREVDRPVVLPRRIERVFDAPVEPGSTAGRLVKPRIDWSEWDKAAETSMRVTGPVGQKQRARSRVRFKDAQDASLVEAAGAAMRQVRVGERQTLLRTVAADTRTKGWIRVTDSDPCAFCAMLASRGPVYKKDSASRSDPRFAGPGSAKVHDNCACTLEPVYATDTGWPGRAKEFQKLWNDNIRGRYSGRDAINAWRRLYEARQREARREAVA